ncbi:DNA-binding transcriptional regulator, ArsR family [Jannaschia faecimaris]|uniref:DNA-binding transcriptional regulator, ArsR family n=1 Tax=Jannaschia faecimaris TaxID=1244108 RepID=A0A1H3S247_9RHOB|nr:metalloregulator ArsR/SmtB family transcription factor [Jannaschia faecimaris]SDZ32076.1 DNA-binding transcriptional regulator, ArsR family [Jannaschia faecimaris]
MTYEAILTALADPTRRAVLERLRDEPLPVGRIAEDLPVSRPAVSQHLKVLLDAGLVSMQASGTRNLYALLPGGAAPLLGWLGDLRSAPAAPGTAPGWRRSLATRLNPHEAWQLFCDDLAIWWPVARFSISAHKEGALPQAVFLDPVVGGALSEILYDGSKGIWATVIDARKPDCLTLDWQMGVPDRSEVRIDFTAERDGARVTLQQDAETPEATALWDAVMERFASAANASLSNF